MLYNNIDGDGGFEMSNFIGVFLVVAIMIGFANTVLSYLLHKKYQNQLSKIYFILTVCLFVENATAVFISYGFGGSATLETQYWLGYINIAVSLLAHVGYIYVALMTTKVVFKIKRLPRLFWIILSFIYIVEGVYIVIQPESITSIYFIHHIITLLIYGLILSTIVIDVKNLQHVVNPTIRGMLKRVMIVFIIVFSIMLIESMLPTEVSIGGPIVVTILHLFGIYYTLKYIFLDNEKLTSTSFEKISNVLKENNITERETEIILLILESYTNKEISDSLFISEGTVKNHIYNIYKKLDVRNRTELVNYLKPLD